MPSQGTSIIGCGVLDFNEPGREQKLTKAITDIRAWYLSGAPLFTKESLNNIRHQLKELGGKTGTVYVQGLDGNLVGIPITPGLVRSYPKIQEETVLEGHYIHYFPIQDLISITRNRIPRFCYCSVVIDHYCFDRDKFTKEVINPESPQSIKDSRDMFLESQRRWEESELCKQLISTIHTIRTPGVEKIVAFACGSFRLDFLIQDLRPPKTSFQHALALTLRHELGKKQGGHDGSVTCYAQDPDYSEVDKSILAEAGIEVVDDPDGFLMVDDSSVVLSFSPNAPVRQIICELAKPAIIIWKKANEEDPVDSFCDPALLNAERQGLDPDSSRVREFIANHYESFQILEDEAKHFGKDTVLYVRRAVETIIT